MVLDCPPAGLFRRLAALLYDGLLVIAVLFIAALPLPLVEESVRTLWWARTLAQLYLVTAWFLFFGWFWTHGGQTVGMKAWHIELLCANGDKPSWRDALIRFLVSSGSFWLLLALFGLEILSGKTAFILAGSVFGLAFLWTLIDRKGCAWHDHLSRTRLVMVPPRAG
jgi:uncharacterized RDD family membrane protein YckC